MTSRSKAFSARETPHGHFLTRSVPIEVNPPEIVFKDIEANQIYEITVEIRNLTKKAVRIRLQKPTNPSFKVEYSMQQEIAPGLAMLAKIKYESKEIRNETQKVTITTEDGYAADLPIRVYKMQSQLLFQPFVNLGFVKVGKSKTDKIVFKNQGKATGIVELSHDHAPMLKIQPSLLTIAPQEVSYLNVTFKAEEAGLFKGVINLKSQSMLLKNTIDIHATSVEYSKFFIDQEGNQQSSFDFGVMYVGQYAQLPCYLVNNSPKKLRFRTNFRLGFKVSPEEFTFVQSPAELGHEQNQRVMHCEPSEGEIGSFSQISLKFICKSKITYKEQIYTKNFAITAPGEEVTYSQSQKLQSDFKPENTHEYSVLFDFFEEEPIILQLKGITSCPLIKVEKNVFQFGDCASHQRRHIAFSVKNTNPSARVELTFPKIPNFSIEPSHVIMDNKTDVELVAAFEPKNIGKFDTTQSLILNKLYEIPLRFFGISSTQGRKQLGKRGPQGLLQDFDKKKSFVGDLQQEDPQALRKKAFSLTSEKSFLNKVRNSELPEIKMLQLSQHILNKDKYNSVLPNRRTDRMNHEKNVIVEKKWSVYTQKMKEMGIYKKYEEKEDQEGLKIAPPIDYEFQVGMINTRLSEPKLPLPENNQSLFVTRHLGPYEPIEHPIRESEKYNPNPLQKPKKVQAQKPQNFNEQRDANSEISSSQLEKIEVGPLAIDFGEVFVKSSTSRYFWIKNSTKKCIAARLICDPLEFRKSYQKTQIIQSCSEAGFEIVLCKDTIGEVRTSLKYILNEKYVFEMSVTGKVVPVALEVSKLNLKFTYADDNLDMATYQTLKLVNKGNSKAMFKFTLTKERLYVPDVLQGEVEANSSRDIKVKFVAPVPAIVKNEYIYTQRLLLKVLDGVESTITCMCTIPEAKLTIKPPAAIDLGVLCLGQQIVKYLNIKNNSKNSSIAIEVSSSGIQGLTCSEKFSVRPDDSKDVEIRYKATTEGENTGQIIMKIRGSKQKIIECKAKCINPKITFEPVIDYQYVIVAGYPGVRQLTLNNTSDVEVPLIIDLREKSINKFNPEGVECVQVKMLSQDGSLEVIYPERPPSSAAELNSGRNLVALDKDKQPQNILNNLELQQDEDLGSDYSQQEKEKQIDERELRRYRLTMKPQKTYNIEVKFFAKEVKDYVFNLPIEIQNYGIIQSPLIKCKGIKPQFLFEPQIIDFKRKVITTPDKCFPRYIPVTLTNPDTKAINWSLDDTAIAKEQIFSLQMKKGRLGPGQTVTIKAGFNPYEVGNYTAVMPLYIEDEEVKQKSKYLDVEIKGTAAFPSINFSRREVILPVVPLNIVATTSFRIFNDGYENVNLKSQLLDDVANLGLVISFPQGKSLGITRQKIKVEVSWKYAKPMSFTIKLQFSDDMNRTYTIPISGTADNCFFTNYAYFLRSQGKYKIQNKDNLIVREIEEDEENPTRVRRNSAHSMRSSKTNATNKSLLSYLGSSMIKPGLLENTIEYLTRYLNANILTSRIDEFPRSLIENDGAQLFEIISFFTPKSGNFPWRCTIKEKSQKKVEALYNQYSQLIKMLKTEGALLNHIRPEYLLSNADLNTYLQNILPPEQSKNYSSSLMRVSGSLYSYLSMDSWISLLYQMFRIYLLSRVNLKTYKQHIGETLPNKTGNILDVPKSHLQESNYMSASQGILCYWIESSVLQVLLEQRRITNFDKDFRDGVMIAVLLQKYANLKILRNMKVLCSGQEDYKQNANVAVKGLEEIGLNSHILPKDISHPLQREMLLFLLHLYNYLPFYTPRQEPIEFKCVLGQEVVRNIELNNPSNKPVFYEAKYEGSPDFTMVGETNFKIEPKHNYKFQVKFCSRVSQPVTGRITFVNKKQNSIAAAALVFELKSNITGKVSDKAWNISGPLYEQIDFPIDIVNKFTSVEMADFSVTVLTQYLYDKKAKTKNMPQDQELQTIYPKFEVIKLRKNITTSFQLSYLPISLHSTKTTIIFSNPTVGQFQHEITATVEAPAIAQQVKPPMTLTVDQILNWQLPIQFKNQAMLKARKIIESFKKAGKRSAKESKRPAQEEQSNPVTFFVEIPPNPYISSKQTITMIDKKDTTKKKDDELVAAQNCIPLTFVCKNPVFEYSAILTVRNAEKTDVRRYRVVISVQPKPLKAILEMNVPARSQVTQNLPILNNTDKDWIIKVNWLPDPLKNGSYFSIPSQFQKEFPVKKKSTGNLPVTFKPRWTNKAQARLTLNNPVTMDQFEYEIRGQGEDPLAEEHLEIRCQSKKKFKKEIIVKNPYQEKPVTFNVETDLMNCICSKTLNISSGGKQKFEFTVQPMLCGEYTGSITFTEEDGGQYIWYTISVITDFPTTLKTTSLVTEIRKPLIHEIEIPNDGKESVNYEVILAGQGLSGPPLFEAKSKTTNKYLLKYLPFRVGRGKGSICFINPQVGQLLYEFDLTCQERQTTKIHGIRSPLGVQKPISLEVENPSTVSTTIQVQNSNPEIFQMSIHSFKLQPGERKVVQVLYTPSSLDATEEADIRLASKDIGSWHFSLQGLGLPPVPAQPMLVYNNLYNEQTNILRFRNPFRYDIVVGVKMVCKNKESQEVFRLITKSRSSVQNIRANDTLQIPFSFIPVSCRRYQCTITVVISEKIQWAFPVVGLTEINSNETVVHLKSKCREKAREYKQLFLTGLEDINSRNGQSNKFVYELENIPKNVAHLINKFLVIDQHKDSLSHNNDFLEFQFLFKPLKPCKVSLDFIVKKLEGPLWRYRLTLQATDPDPDDVIHIESPLLVTTSVSFKLTNWEKNEADFTARFTSDSANQFSVEPKEGRLAPFGSAGTNFIISFTPIEYGKEKKGKLQIETADMFWSYLLKGDLPKYNPPKVTASSIDNKSSLQRSSLQKTKN